MKNFSSSNRIGSVQLRISQRNGRRWACLPHRYHTFGDYTLNGGVGSYGSANRYYWIDASAFSSSQISSIISAAQTWVYTSSAIGVTTPISIERTTTQSSSVFDVYKKILRCKYLRTNRILDI